ncbi:MAG: Fur family transcriptional regulator [Acidimicrobiales bacterium]
MDDLLTRLRTRDDRLTAQRGAAAEVLQGEQVHLTADEVLARAVVAIPEISRATVYNALGELVAVSEVRKVDIAHGRAVRYDPNVAGPHHHLVCRGCGLILDVPVVEGTVPALPLGSRHGFAVEDVEVTYRGLCPRCTA